MTHKMNRRTAMGVMAAAGAMMAAPRVFAASYPDRPILMMIPYGAGGATDFQARIVTIPAANEDMLGQPIAIINKPGAGGRVGWNWFATQAPKDGYTLASYNVPHFIAQSIKGGVEYSTASFEPLANWGADPAVFVVGKDSEFQSMEDVLKFAKDNPGKLTFSGAGLFVGHHIAALQLEKASGVKLAYIPNNKGGAGAMKAVIAGEVMAGVNNLSDAFRARAAGDVRILAVFDTERNSFMEDVPIASEFDLDIDASSVNYRGIMAPAGVPGEVIERMSAVLPGMFEHRRVKQRMKATGSPLKIMDRAAVQAMWAERQSTLEELLAGL